jgi:hypothetical protein
MSYRSDAVSEALAEWRAHPEGRPDLYWREVLRPEDLPFKGDYCGAFVLRSLKRAGMARDVPWIIGHGFISPQGLKQISFKDALPGDVVFVPQPFQHQAMLVSYEPTTGMVTTIDGNQPGIEPKVRFAQNGNLQVYSIQKFVDEAEARFPWVWVGAGVMLAAAAALLLPEPTDRLLRRVGL